MEKDIKLFKLSIITMKDNEVIQLSFSNDIIGLAKNNNKESYKIFRYSEYEGKQFKENAFFISKEEIFSFLILKERNNELIIISQERALKIYQINEENFQLNITIKLDYYIYNINMKIINYSDDIIALFIKDNTPTSGWSCDKLIFYNKKLMKIISEKWLNVFGDLNSLYFFSKKQLYLCSEFRGIKAGVIRENKNIMDININHNAYTFIKLNEDEICAYEKNNEEGRLSIYEFE